MADFVASTRRIFFGLIVVLLAFSASGASALVLAEPCTGVELPGEEDAACPPTCVTCGCCAQAAEPMQLHLTAAAEVVVDATNVPTPHLPNTPSRDILHVPKLLIS